MTPPAVDYFLWCLMTRDSYSMCPVRQVRGCEVLGHRCSVNQCLPVLKPFTYLLNTQGG